MDRLTKNTCSKLITEIDTTGKEITLYKIQELAERQFIKGYSAALQDMDDIVDKVNYIRNNSGKRMNISIIRAISKLFEEHMSELIDGDGTLGTDKDGNPIFTDVPNCYRQEGIG